MSHHNLQDGRTSVQVSSTKICSLPFSGCLVSLLFVSQPHKNSLTTASLSNHQAVVTLVIVILL